MFSTTPLCSSTNRGMREGRRAPRRRRCARTGRRSGERGRSANLQRVHPKTRHYRAVIFRARTLSRRFQKPPALRTEIAKRRWSIVFNPVVRLRRSASRSDARWYAPVSVYGFSPQQRGNPQNMELCGFYVSIFAVIERNQLGSRSS